MKADATRESSAPGPGAGETDAVSDELSSGVVPRAVLLLAGATRRVGLADQLARSPLELPVEGDRRVFDLWLSRLSALARATGASRLPVRVLVNDRVPRPDHRTGPAGLAVSIELDGLELRGTAGLLADSCADYDDDDWVLIASGGQIVTRSLIEPYRRLQAAEGVFRLLRHEDGAPGGVALMRCGVLRDVASQGYIDLKEQFLPKLAERERVVTVDHPTITLPVRTVNDYIQGLQAYHRGKDLDGAIEPYAEDWRSSFSIIESGADVEQTARLHDSVVLSGGRVGARAILVRSVVCKNGVVHAGRMQRDAVIGGRQSGVSSTEGRSRARR
ncbi:hypothetical protein Pan265_08140 [Mucisphaera calidilacus]|uniref:Uncharacterized protein n=1 Tax=Mucisphaera calidilacus TaxID=2527982 RepID=A0A518BVG0_9BACT|nr:hypothetical protein Pan265_08140 [Mucisphaera calidilacus]